MSRETWREEEERRGRRVRHLCGGEIMWKAFLTEPQENTSIYFEDAACLCTSPRQLSSEHNRQLEAPMEAQETVNITGERGGGEGVRRGGKIKITFVCLWKTLHTWGICLCAVCAYENNYTKVTSEMMLCRGRRRPPLTSSSSPTVRSLCSLEWNQVLDVLWWNKVDRSCEHFHRSVPALVSHMEAALGSTADLIFQDLNAACFQCSFILRAGEEEEEEQTRRVKVNNADGKRD